MLLSEFIAGLTAMLHLYGDANVAVAIAPNNTELVFVSGTDQSGVKWAVIQIAANETISSVQIMPDKSKMN